MLFSLDKKPSLKIVVVLIVIGGALFLSSFIALNLLLRASGADPVEFRAAWQSLDGARIAAYYAGTGNSAATEFAALGGAAGYALFGFAASFYLARRVTAGRAFTRLCYAAALIAPTAALCDLFATAVVLIALLAHAPLPAPLLAPVLFALNAKGIVWFAFLWLLFLAVFILIDRWRRKRKARAGQKHPPAS